MQATLDPFTPRGMKDQPREFVHVEEITGTVCHTSNYTDVDVTIELAEGELMGSEAKAAEGVMAFVVVALESDPGGSTEIGDTQLPFFQTLSLGTDPLEHEFESPGFDNAFLVAGGTFDAIENYIVSPLSGMDGKTTLSFRVFGDVTRRLKVAVMGTALPLDPLASPLTFDGDTLDSFRMLKREQVSEWVTEVPTACN